jgi:hypothetical protein
LEGAKNRFTVRRKTQTHMGKARLEQYNSVLL